MRRFVCIDFETNGFPSKNSTSSNDWPLPFSSIPIQVSVDVVDSSGYVDHAYDSIIQGATQLCSWVRAHVPIRMDQIATSKPLIDVVDDIARVLQEGDVIVAHNIAFDLDLALARTCTKMNIRTPALQRILSTPRFCTMRCAYSRSVFERQPKLIDMCRHFGVDLVNAHDARADTAALASCVATAIRRGVMLDV